MSRIAGTLFRLPFHLILVGIALGYLARAIHPPEKVEMAPRHFKTPVVTPDDIPDEFTELPLLE